MLHFGLLFADFLKLSFIFFVYFNHIGILHFEVVCATHCHNVRE